MNEQLPQFNPIYFLITILIATGVGIVGLLAGLKCMGIIVPKWDLQRVFKQENITNSGLIITAYIIGMSLIIYGAIY